MGDRIEVGRDKIEQLVGDDFDALLDFERAMWAEEEPGAPPAEPEVVKRQTTRTPAGFERLVWTARETDGTIAGLAMLEGSTEENLDLGDVFVRVRPSHRRRGLGRRLLREAAEAAHADGRESLAGYTRDRPPAGEGFASAAGATKELVVRESELDLVNVDRALLQSGSMPGDGSTTATSCGSSSAATQLTPTRRSPASRTR